MEQYLTERQIETMLELISDAENEAVANNDDQEAGFLQTLAMDLNSFIFDCNDIEEEI